MGFQESANYLLGLCRYSPRPGADTTTASCHTPCVVILGTGSHGDDTGDTDH